MPIKRYALVKTGTIRNIALWDGVTEYDPATTDYIAGTEEYPRTKIGDVATRTHNVIIDGNSLARAHGAREYIATDKAVIEVGLKSFDVINKAANGHTTTDLISTGSSKVDALYSAPLTNKNIVVFWEGVNDVVKLGLTASQAYNNIKTYCQNRKTQGFKTVVATILPATQLNESIRVSLNSLIKLALTNSETWIDRVADVASDSAIGAAGANLNTTYYSDGLHLTVSGQQLAMPYFRDALQGLI